MLLLLLLSFQLFFLKVYSLFRASRNLLIPRFSFLLEPTEVKQLKLRSEGGTRAQMFSRYYNQVQLTWTIPAVYSRCTKTHTCITHGWKLWD